jgi:hypothetical protein
LLAFASFCLARKATLGITIGLLLCLVSVILLLDWWVAWTFYSTNMEHHLLVVQFCSLLVSAQFWFIQKSVSNQYKQITWHGFFFRRLGNLIRWAHLYLVSVGGHALNNWFRDLWYHMVFLKGPADDKIFSCLVKRLDSVFIAVLS